MYHLAKTLMLQGTASSVGKSLLTAAMCRILRQDGIRVAPFKAQNMALNAAVTPAGGEIGRAQAVQAEAAGLTPTVEMNPILLKPEGGMRSQVVVLGKAAASMTWSEYQERRGEWMKIVDECIARLRREFEVVIIEGAGSPAEINLRSQDLVNMHVAEAAEAPVLLIGDIDRGGVFAQLVGTMELLEAEDRARIAGFVINKFRGDGALLKPALDYLESRYGLPVLGVVPYLERLRIAEEDSVGLDRRPRELSRDPDEVKIVVVRLPGISNYDDFSALEHEPGVAVIYTADTDAIVRCDLAIVPGSKNTMNDLAWMRRRGLDRALASRSRSGGLTLGICGGCQMLGRRIEDPGLVESGDHEADGVGLLPLVTRFESVKRTTQVRAAIAAESIFGDAGEIEGYEIHMGRTVALDGAAAPFRVISRNGSSCDVADGAISNDGATIGTMLHGIFENRRLRCAMLAALRMRKGLPAAAAGAEVADRGAEYDRLADAVRAAVNIAAVKRIAKIA